MYFAASGRHSWASAKPTTFFESQRGNILDSRPPLLLLGGAREILWARSPCQNLEDGYHLLRTSKLPSRPHPQCQYPLSAYLNVFNRRMPVAAEPWAQQWSRRQQQQHWGTPPVWCYRPLSSTNFLFKWVYIRPQLFYNLRRKKTFSFLIAHSLIASIFLTVVCWK